MTEKVQFDSEKHKYVLPEEGGGFVDKTALDLETAATSAEKVKKNKELLIKGEGWFEGRAYDAANAIAENGGEGGAVATVDSMPITEKLLGSERAVDWEKRSELGRYGITMEYEKNHDPYDPKKEDLVKLFYTGPTIDGDKLDINLGPNVLFLLSNPDGWEASKNFHREYISRPTSEAWTSEGWKTHKTEQLAGEYERELEEMERLEQRILKLPPRVKEKLTEFGLWEHSLVGRELSIYQKTGLVSDEQADKLKRAVQEGKMILMGSILGGGEFRPDGPYRAGAYQHARWWTIAENPEAKEK